MQNYHNFRVAVGFRVRVLEHDYNLHKALVVAGPPDVDSTGQEVSSMVEQLRQQGAAAAAESAQEEEQLQATLQGLRGR
jgi:hypothetical protein